LLGSEYGWTKDYVFYNVYFDELFELANLINNRKRDEYRVLLAIAQNPHTKDPKQLWQILESDEERKRSLEFDEKGFDAFKAAMSQTGKFVVK